MISWRLFCSYLFCVDNFCTAVSCLHVICTFCIVQPHVYYFAICFLMLDTFFPFIADAVFCCSCQYSHIAYTYTLMIRNALACPDVIFFFFGELRRHIMVHNFYSLCNVCLYSWTCPRLLFWNYSSRFLFLVYGCVSLGWSRSRSMTLGLSNQRNDWCSLMYHGLVDLGSLILDQSIPKKRTQTWPG